MEDYDFIIPIVSFNNIKFVKRVTEEIGARGSNFVVVPKNRHVRDEMKEHFSDSQIVNSIESYSPKKDMDSLLDKYNIYSAKNLIFSDLVYEYNYLNPNYNRYLTNDKIPYDDYQKILHKWLDTFDRIYNTKKPIPIQNQGGEIFRRSLSIVSSHHGVPSIWRGFSPLPGKCALHGNSRLAWKTFDEIHFDELSNEEIEAAKDFVDTITKSEDTFTKSEQSLTDEVSQKYQAIRAYKSNLIRPTIGWLREAALSKIKGKYFYRYYLSKRDSERAIKENSIIFYPIQYFRESRVTMRANAFYNQLWLIEYLSRSLPYGYELVVKDHPHKIGELPISFPKKIARVSQLVHPQLNSRKIIKEADAVITLNNTVGMESLLFGKPVIGLGDGFYSNSDYVYQTEDINKIKYLINEAVNSPGLTEKEVIEVGAAINSGSYAGVWGNESWKNVKRFTGSIFEYIEDDNLS